MNRFLTILTLCSALLLPAAVLAEETETTTEPASGSNVLEGDRYQVEVLSDDISVSGSVQIDEDDDAKDEGLTPGQRVAILIPTILIPITTVAFLLSSRKGKKATKQEERTDES